MKLSWETYLFSGRARFKTQVTLGQGPGVVALSLGASPISIRASQPAALPISAQRSPSAYLFCHSFTCNDSTVQIRYLYLWQDRLSPVFSMGEHILRVCSCSTRSLLITSETHIQIFLSCRLDGQCLRRGRRRQVSVNGDLAEEGNGIYGQIGPIIYLRERSNYKNSACTYMYICAILETWNAYNMYTYIHLHPFPSSKRGKLTTCTLGPPPLISKRPSSLQVPLYYSSVTGDGVIHSLAGPGRAGPQTKIDSAGSA